MKATYEDIEDEEASGDDSVLEGVFCCDELSEVREWREGPVNSKDLSHISPALVREAYTWDTVETSFLDETHEWDCRRFVERNEGWNVERFCLLEGCNRYTWLKAEVVGKRR